jgi:hypothetical protein
MRDLMQEFPQAKHRIETLMKLNNYIIQDTRKLAVEEARKAVHSNAENIQCS